MAGKEKHLMKYPENWPHNRLNLIQAGEDHWHSHRSKPVTKITFVEGQVRPSLRAYRYRIAAYISGHAAEGIRGDNYLFHALPDEFPAVCAAIKANA
jgi:hypothetical protein